jgi:hypothetical protein
MGRGGSVGMHMDMGLDRALLLGRLGHRLGGGGGRSGFGDSGAALLVVGDDASHRRLGRRGLLDHDLLLDDDDLLLLAGAVVLLDDRRRRSGHRLGAVHLGLLYEVGLLFLRALVVIRHTFPLGFLVVLVLEAELDATA